MKKQFYVLNWDFNSDSIEHYDVLPYLRRVYKDRANQWKKNQKSKRFQKRLEEGILELKYYKAPENWKELKEFLLGEARYQFWARCEYEMICTGWPVRKNDHKLDVYEQIEMNIDIITDILYEEFFCSTKR